MSIKENEYNPFVNGLRQHIFFFYDLLVELGFTVILLNTNKFTFDNINMLHYNHDNIDNYESYNLDLIFEMGGEIPYAKLKTMKPKIVAYGCGNSYVLNMEEILFKKNVNNLQAKNKYYTEFWTNKQHINTNKYYIEALYNAPVIEVPHIWEPTFIEKANIFTELPSEPRVTIFEPNMNVVKTSIYPLLIAEKYTKKFGNLKHVYTMNTYTHKDNGFFKRFVLALDIVQRKIVSFEKRFETPTILNKFTDLVISHQWENALNYLYYELLYLHYPLIHNSQFLSDVGYYYDGFNVDAGVNQLYIATQSHNKNKAEYNKKCDDFVKTVSIYNKEIQAKYLKLITDLFF